MAPKELILWTWSLFLLFALFITFVGHSGRQSQSQFKNDFFQKPWCPPSVIVNLHCNQIVWLYSDITKNRIFNQSSIVKRNKTCSCENKHSNNFIKFSIYSYATTWWMTDSSRNAATIGTNLFYNFDCTLVTAEVQRFFPVKSGVLTNYSKFFFMIAYTQLLLCSPGRNWSQEQGWRCISNSRTLYGAVHRRSTSKAFTSVRKKLPRDKNYCNTATTSWQCCSLLKQAQK